MVFYEEYSDEINGENFPLDIRNMKKERLFFPWIDNLYNCIRPANPPKKNPFKEIDGIIFNESDGPESVDNNLAVN